MILIFSSKYPKELRRECEFVQPDEHSFLFKILFDELSNHSSAVGLAAPQIGYNKKAAIIEANNGFIYFANPRITKKSNPFLFRQEGCLSFPDKRIDTIRYFNIVVEDDENGTMELNNFAAVAAAHEIEHLEGKLFFDNEVPGPYDKCFCGSDKKFKFCCKDSIMK
jgi:peptide deformylase